MILYSQQTFGQPALPPNNQSPARQQASETTAYHVSQLKESPRRITAVNLHHLNLKAVPPELEQCRNIKSLSLSDNHIETLPPFVSQFTRLETLDLSGMSTLNATQLFDNIKSLRQLKSLDLSDGAFVILPYQVTALQKLEYLDLSNNLFEDIPSFALELLSLNTLNLANNRLKTLDYDIYKLQELAIIDLSNNPGLDYNDAIFTLSFLFNLKDVQLRGLDKFPEEINKLQQINKLDLSNGKFFTIPSKIGDLVSLNQLKLNNCNKLDLKDALSKFGGNSQIQRMECINNKVYFFPKGLGKFTSLKELVLGGSLLKFISPDFKKLSKLQSLQVINSPLIDLRDLVTRLSDFKSFKKLSLTRCNFSEFPPEIAKLTDIEELDLSGNQIKMIPMSIGRIKGLKVLNMQGNPLTEDNIRQVKLMLPECEIICNSIVTAIQPINPNLVAKPASIFPFSPTKKQTIIVDDRTRLKLPADAFMTSNNKLAEGSATLHVTAINHPFDSWEHGLPTTIDSLKYKYDLHTAGQFKITAEKNGESLKFIPGNSITIEFESTLDEKEPLEILRYYPAGNSWGKHGWDEVTGKSNEATDNPFGKGFTGIQRPGLPVAPIKPTVEELSVSFYTQKRKPFISVKGKYHQDLKERQLENNEKAFSDLSEIEKIAWIYDGDNWKRDSKVMDTLMNINQQLYSAKRDRRILDDLCLSYGELNAKKAVDVVVENREGDNQYKLQFVRTLDTVELPVISYELPEGQAFFNNYQALRQQRQQSWKSQDETYRQQLDKYQKKVDDYREEISKYSEDMGPLGGFKEVTSFKYKRIAKIGALGDFIIGKIQFQDNNQLLTRYLDQNNNTIFPTTVILLDESKNNFIPNKSNILSYDPRSKNSLIAMFSNGDMGLFPSGLFRQLNKNGETEITEIPLIIIKSSEISNARVKCILGI